MQGRAELRELTTRWDVLLALLLLGVAVAEIVGGGLDSPAARTAYAAATTSSLLVRRTLPLLATGIASTSLVAQSLLLESPDEIGVLLAVIIVAFSIAAHAPTRDLVTGATMLAVSIAVAVGTDPSDSTSNILPTLLLFLGLPIGLGLTVRRRQRDLVSLRLAALARADEAAEAVEAERRRIARELHDVVSHAVTLIAVQAEAGQSVIATDPAAAERSLAAIAGASRDALIELDRMLHVLRDADGDPVESEGGLERLPALVEGARSAGLTVELTTDAEVATVPAGAASCAFRVVQEGLTNALRHAPGSNVAIRISSVSDELEVVVHSTARRRAKSYGGSGRGLAGLRERVASLGGNLETRAADNGDFLLRVVLPGARA